MIAPEQVDRIILSGSFNPFHEGHHRMVGSFLNAYPRYVGKPILLEISRINRDKGAISYTEITARIESIRSYGCHAPVLVTELPRFMDKARVFQDTLFLVGSDTASRILPEEAAELKTLGAYFAVFRREGYEQKIPSELSAYMVYGWTPLDVSSTKIRNEAEEL